MNMMILFRAVAVNEDGEQYDANFMLTYPLNAGIPMHEIVKMKQQVMNDFHSMHKNGKILAVAERVV